MATIEITTEIRENMAIVLENLQIICDYAGHTGSFEFEYLRRCGLSRVHVLEAIEALNAEGQHIYEATIGFGLSMPGTETMWYWDEYRPSDYFFQVA